MIAAQPLQGQIREPLPVANEKTCRDGPVGIDTRAFQVLGRANGLTHADRSALKTQ